MIATARELNFLSAIGRLKPDASLATPQAQLIVTLTASWIPARRAQRTDPLVVLRTN